jgi:hypothetical protein
MFKRILTTLAVILCATAAFAQTQPFARQIRVYTNDFDVLDPTNDNGQVVIDNIDDHLNVLEGSLATNINYGNLKENMTNNTYGYPALDIADFNDVTIDVTDGVRFLKPAMTNIIFGWEFLDTDYRDDVNTDSDGTNWVLGVVSNENIGPTEGYIKGMWPHYVNTNTVYIEPGEGYCNGKYFALTGSNNYSITSTLAVAGDTVYWYIDDDSAFPTPTIYYATNEPSKAGLGTLSLGYYNLVTLDRCFAATLMDDATPSKLRVFDNAFGTYTWLYDSYFNLGVNMATNDPNVWAATTWPLSDVIPVMAESAWLSLQAEDERGFDSWVSDAAPLFAIGVNSANRTPAGTSGNISRLENAQLGLVAPIQGAVSGWLDLDRSRNVTWMGSMTLTATIPTNKVFANGFTLER